MKFQEREMALYRRIQKGDTCKYFELPDEATMELKKLRSAAIQQLIRPKYSDEKQEGHFAITIVLTQVANTSFGI
jgi:hypothetical protein